MTRLLMAMLQVAGMLLDGHNLEFYQWAGDVNELLEKVRTPHYSAGARRAVQW